MKSNLLQIFVILILAISCVENHSPDTIDISKNWHFSPDERNIGTSEKWYAVSFNDSQWKIIDAGKKWEDQGYSNLDSYGWYRKSVVVPADWHGKDLWIKFGGVNDSYELFINGVKVSSFGEDGKSVAGNPTITKLSDNLNYGETNQITVKVNDWAASGGLWRLPIILTTDENNVLNEPTKTIVMGDLQVVFVDNNEFGENHKGGYNGIAELKHTAQDSNVFVPTFAGFNLEHIFAGDSLTDIFEPRKFPMQLEQISKNSVELHQGETALSHVESWTTFTVVPPHYIDITFRCLIHSDEFFNHGYAGLFWASYIDTPERKEINFIGTENSDTTTKKWISAFSEKHGEKSTHLSVNDRSDLFFSPNFNATLANHFSDYRYSIPFYYGRFHNMVLAYMFESSELIRFTQSPNGGGETNPAWDFQFIIPNPRQGKEYSFNARIVYKPFISNEEILEEYKLWKNE